MLACGLFGSIGGDMKSSSPSVGSSYSPLNSASNGLSSASFPLGESALGDKMLRG